MPHKHINRNTSKNSNSIAHVNTYLVHVSRFQTEFDHAMVP
jgi:hypothetical protein